MFTIITYVCSFTKIFAFPVESNLTNNNLDSMTFNLNLHMNKNMLA